MERLSGEFQTLQSHAEGLRKALAEIEEERARKGETDYQLLMARQEMMAAFKDLDPGFQALADFVKPYTMTSVERQYGLYKSVEYICRAKIPGDLIECGVWRGGSMMLAAKTLIAMGDTSRRLILCDTYEGHPKPNAEHDVDLWGNKAVNDWIKYRKSDGTTDWGKVSIEEVEENMRSTGYPMDKVVLIKGKIEDTAASVPATTLSLVRLDTDWYDSARIGLETFWPRLSPGGVLVIDDYGHYVGQRRAVDDFFAASPVLLHRVDYSCRAVIKTK